MPASVAPSVGQRPRHRYQTRRIAPAAETSVSIERRLLALFNRICRVDGRRKFQVPVKYLAQGRAGPPQQGRRQWAHSYSPVPRLTNKRLRGSRLTSKASAHHGHQPSRSIARNAARSTTSPCAIRISMLPWTMPPIHFAERDDSPAAGSRH
jgi:hypothetical protein